MVPNPDDYVHPFDFAAACGTASAALDIVWARWMAAENEVASHQVTSDYDKGHEHGVIAGLARAGRLIEGERLRAAGGAPGGSG